MDIPITLNDGNKVLKVTIEKEHETLTITGKEAEKWILHNRLIATLASVQGQNPFDYDPINWKIKNK
jgi:hypothetical protein